MEQRTNGYRSIIWLEVGLITLAAFLVRLRYAALDYPLFWDEYYHLLAARSWASESTLRIAEGFYIRAPYLTMALGWWFRVFGESLLSAKMIPTIIGTLWVTAVFVWIRSVDSRLAAWVTGLLFCFSPWVIQISGMVRFYGVQALLFWLGCIALFAVVVRRRPKVTTIVLGTFGIAAWGLAVAILPMVLIGIAGFGTWALITIVRSAFAKGEARLAVAAFAALAVGLVIILVVSGKGAYWISLYRWTPGWAIETANEIGHYEGRLIIPYPTLWTLFPVAGLLAIKRQRDAGLMCLIVFATGLGLHSFAAPKADRFFAYLLPFFFAMWGFALAEILPQINRLATHVIRIVIGAAAPPRLTRTFAVTLLAAVISFTLVSNPAFLQMYRIASGGPMARWQSPNWNAATDTLKSLFAQSSVVVTPNSVHALYYLGRYDLEFRETGVYETFSSSEFGIDPRTGRPTISTLESLQLVMSCFPTGVFITENWRWRNSMEGINDDAADFLIANSEEIVLKPEWYIRAFRWDRYPTTPSQPDCSRTRGARR